MTNPDTSAGGPRPEQQRIALVRYRLIAEALNPRLRPRERGRLVREVASRPRHGAGQPAGTVTSPMNVPSRRDGTSCASTAIQTPYFAATMPRLLGSTGDASFFEPRSCTAVERPTRERDRGRPGSRPLRLRAGLLHLRLRSGRGRGRPGAAGRARAAAGHGPV